MARWISKATKCARVFGLETLETALDSHICDTTGMTSAVGPQHPSPAHLCPLHTFPRAWDWAHPAPCPGKAAAGRRELSVCCSGGNCSLNCLEGLKGFGLTLFPGGITPGGKKNKSGCLMSWGCQEMSVKLPEKFCWSFPVELGPRSSRSWFSTGDFL